MGLSDTLTEIDTYTEQSLTEAGQKISGLIENHKLYYYFSGICMYSHNVM